MKRLAITAFALAAACGSDSATKKDAPAGSTVQAVTCPGTPDATITVATSGAAYMPTSAAIAPNGIVRFVLPAAHDVTSTTPGLDVRFGQTACLQFADAGTYSFHCSVHGFQGTVTVQ
jgi:plastocyanin